LVKIVLTSDPVKRLTFSIVSFGSGADNNAYRPQ
jgi:hypothetical protein